MKNRIWVLLSLSLFIMSSCENNNTTKDEDTSTSSFKLNDPIGFKKSGTPLSIPFIIPSDNKLTARILMASGKSQKPTIIFIHGNPGFEKNEDIGQGLRRNGYNCVFFSYSGTWGNNGLFSYSQSIQDTKDIYNYLILNAKQFRIDTKQIFLLGHSMGGDIALLSYEELDGIKGVLTIDPWSGYDVLNNKLDKQLNKYIVNLEQRPCIDIASGSEFVNEIMNIEKMNLEKSIKSSSQSSAYIFSNKKEKNEFHKYHSNIKEDHIWVLNANDHSFSDKRILLTETIYNWLETKN